MNQFGVAVGTYGSEDWAELAQSRAIPSIVRQSVETPYVHVHGDTLADARNSAAASLDVSNLIFLDSDDELDEYYVEAMIESLKTDTGLCLRQPSTAGVENGVVEPPHLIPSRGSIFSGNWMVIGTAIPTEIFFAAEGFWEEPIFEDWSVFMRCAALGCRYTTVPKAVYKVHLSNGGRNKESMGSSFMDIKFKNKQWIEAKGLSVEI